jgi:nucleotide-binding universal stress UspA family protein
MYTRLLVPLDGSPEAEAALSPAHTLATALGSEIILIRVIASGTSSLSTLSSSAPSEASDYLEGLASTLRTSTVRVEVVVSQGNPADTIVGECTTRGADLIVMASHSRRGLERLVMGSVADKVFEHSRVPVLLVRPSEYRMHRLKLILVPVDGSPGSLLGLGTAAGLAREAHAAVVLLRVVVPLPLWIYDPSLGLNTGPLIDPGWDEDRRENAEAYVRGLARSLAHSDIDVGADAVLGEVASAIAEYADEESVDLIVMGTHAHRGPARALLGSITSDVVRTAHHPVLLVNRETARAAGSTAYAEVPTTARASAQRSLS